MKKFSLAAIAAVSVLFFLSSTCATKRLESRLDPVSEEFYSKVRYIMTSEESKIFIELPPSARAEFIEEFWKRMPEHRQAAARQLWAKNPLKPGFITICFLLCRDLKR